MREAFVHRVAEYFKARPGEWIDARDLETVGGRQAWRTRVSNCRRQLGMVIDNRQTTRRLADGTPYTVSEYRYLPYQPLGRDPSTPIADALVQRR